MRDKKKEKKKLGLYEIEHPAEFKEVLQFTVKQGKMVKTTVMKTKFLQLNDKSFIFRMVFYLYLMVT